MTALEALGIRGDALPRIELACGEGLHVIVVDEPRAGAELVEILAGLKRPRRGVLRVLGRDPFRAPEVRARVAALLAEEESLLPDGGSALSRAEDGLGRVLALHGSTRTANSVLDDHGLSALGSRRAPSAAERRALALALALSLEEIQVFVLFEPFATVLDRARVARTLAERSRSATVIAVTTSLREARALGGRLLHLTQSGIVQASPDALPMAGSLELVASVDEPLRLAERLAAEPSLQGVTWEGGSPSELVLRGPDVEALSLALFAACHESGVRITSLHHRAARAARPMSPLAPSALPAGSSLAVVPPAPPATPGPESPA